MNTVAGVSVTGGSFTANATAGDLRVGGVQAPSINLITTGNLSQGSGVASVALANATGNYTILPNGNYPALTFSGGGGAGAVATGVWSTIYGGNLAIGGNVQLLGVTITNAGTGYSSAPTLTLFETVTPVMLVPVLLTVRLPPTVTVSASVP